MIPLRYWIYIATVIGALFAVNYALSKAYDQGVEYQQTIQRKADDLATDLRNAEKERIENAAAAAIATANTAADNAIYSADRLRRQLDEIKRLAQNASGTFAPGATARDAVVLLADLLRQCSERYVQLGKFADTAHIAGQTCERQYDSLRLDGK